MPDNDNTADEQDQSEVFDEDNMDASETGGVTNEFKTFEETPDVLDVTSAEGDADEEDFDEDDRDLDEALSAEGIEPEADGQFGADASRVTDQDLGADEAGEDEVELVYSGLMEDTQGAQASAAHWEAKRLSDDDIVELGYGPEGRRAMTGADDRRLDDLAPERAATHDPKDEDGGHARPAHPLGEAKHDHLAEQQAKAENRQEALVDEGVEETFPASDPVAVKRIT